MSGTTPHRGSTFMQSLALDGTSAFYALGQVEGFDPVSRFATTAPQSRTTLLSADFLTGFDSVATDGTKVYISNGGSGAEQQYGPYTTFVVARNVSDNSTYIFPNGQHVVVNGNVPSDYPSCIDVNLYTPPPPAPSPDPRVNPNRPTGLAVQKTGNILAIAHGGIGLIRLFDKASGALLSQSISVPNPQGLAAAPNGDLWVISGTSLRRYKDLATTPSLVQQITGFVAPVAVSVHPSNNDIVLVADGGSAQVIKAFNRSASNVNQALWTYGQVGGYSNGPDVTDNKFAFQVGARNDPFIHTALAVQSDGSFWIGDGGTSRLMHINSSHSTSLPADTIMFLPHNGWTAVDMNNPRRVIGDNYLEFEVDYTKPIQQGWTLKKNWAAGLDSKYLDPFSGINSISTLSNNRIYGTVNDTVSKLKVVIELPAAANQPLRICKDASNNDLVLAKIDQAPDFYGAGGQLQSPSFEIDGSLRYQVFSQPGSPQVAFYKKALSGFDAFGNPQWAAPTLLASAAYNNSDPAALGDYDARFPITSSNVIVSFDPGHDKWTVPPEGSPPLAAATGWHLGGVSVGSSAWEWKASRAVAAEVPFDNLGSFDIGDGVQYAGSVAMALGQNVLYGYPGEFWNQTEAGQWMHFYDDGLFVGEFGTSGIYRNPSRGALAGFSGNSFYPTLVGVGSSNEAASDGDVYLWANDESQHSGVIRWHVLGTNTIREQSGTVSLGGSVSLTGSSASFPTALSARPGDGQVMLSWTAGAGVGSYDVKRSTTSGGPYATIFTTTSTSYTVPGLTNGTPYYFVVSASGAQINSNQVQAFPFNVVGKAGQLTGGAETPFQVNSTAPMSGQPALVGLSDVFGNLAHTNVGTKGYVVYNWSPTNRPPDDNSLPVPFTTNSNLLSPFSATVGSGWFNQSRFVSNRFTIDGVVGADCALNLHNGFSGVINISVSDTATHYLTVFCPPVFADQRQFTIKIKPVGQNSPVASYTVDEPQGSGENHILQFVFSGNITLSIENVSGFYGNAGCLQAILFD